MGSEVEDPFFKNFLLQLQRADSGGVPTAAIPNPDESQMMNLIHPTLIKTASMPPVSLRRATSYCGAQTQNEAPDYEGCGRDVAEVLSSGSTLTAKHRHLLQARQAWIKYQIQLTSSTTQSFKQQR